MHFLFLFISIAFILYSTPFAQSETITVDGKNREFILHVPADLPENPPLVLALHPLGATNSQFRSMSGWDAKADEEKFIVVYPQGIYKLEEMGGMIGWDIYSDAGVIFLTTLIDTLAVRYDIDLSRVYSTGFSMGGMMSYKLACSVADRIAAIGPDAGYLLGENVNSCTPSRPVPLCHVHGADDDFVNYDGVEEWVERFADINGCRQSPETTTSSNYRKEDWTPCENDNDVVFYTVEGMGHDYATSSKYGFSATDTFWTFFEKFPGEDKVSIDRATAGRQTPLTFRAIYSGGSIHITGNEEIRSVRIVDVRGRAVFSSKNTVEQYRKTVVPIDGFPAKVCILIVEGSSGNTSRKLLVP